MPPRDLLLRDLINEFIECQRIDRGSAQKTIQAYRNDLNQLEAWLPQGTRLERIDDAMLGDFLASLSRSGNRASSIARKASALRQFFKFCVLAKKLAQNPAEKLESPSLPKKLPKHLIPERVQALLNAVDEGIPYSVPAPEQLRALQARDAAMVYLLYATGLRVSELVGLKIGNLELEQGYVRVRGKGSKERIAPFAPKAGDYVREYLAKHRPRLVKADQPTDVVFLNRGGRPITRQGFWKNLTTLAAMAGLEGKLSPHVLRHSFATHLLQSGMNLRSLQMLLGHADLSTTQIYTRLTPGHLKAAHRKYHPRGGG